MPLELNKLNTLEEVLSADWNLLQYYSARGLLHILQHLLTVPGVYPAMGTPPSGFLSGFGVIPGAGLSVVVSPVAAATATSAAVPGIGVQYDQNNTPGLAVPPFYADDSPLRLLWLATATTLNLAAADPTNPRIDLVEAQWSLSQTNVQSRNIWNPVTKTYSASNVYKSILPSVLLQVKTGTPAGSPVAPAVDAGFLTVATVNVAALAVSIIQGNITDKRSLLSNLTAPILTDEVGGKWKLIIASTGELSAQPVA